MKVLFIGLGSIGQRHLRNLVQMGEFEILAFRRRGLPLPSEFDSVPIKVFSSLDSALAQKPDCCIIGAPPIVQQEVLPEVISSNCHFFIEKPIAPSYSILQPLEKEVTRRSLVSMIGYNLRHHPVHAQLKSLIDSGAIGSIVSARVSVGQYLPEWHPKEDYRQGYSARRDLGGGAVLDLIHEIDFICSLFGEVEDIQAMLAKRSHLQISTEDTAEILLRFKSGIIGSVHVDYVQRHPFRNGMIIGDEGTLTYDLLTRKISHYSAEGQAVEYNYPDFVWNEMYYNELKQFLKAVQNRVETTPDFSWGLEMLRIAVAAKGK